MQGGMNVIQASILVMCVVICGFIIRKEAPAYVNVLTLVVCLIISINIVRYFSTAAGYINVLMNNMNIEKGYIRIIMKITGMSMVTQLISDICKDNGYNAMASQLELLCRVSIVLISMPVIIALIKLINGCLG